jgi:hypothetical protein
MTYATTATRSSTTTTTDARVRYVMQKVMANFTGLAVCDLITAERAAKWSVDLTYLQMEDALAGFQVQFKEPGVEPYGLQYRVSNDGSLQQDSSSGGLDFYGVPRDTPVTLCLDLKLGKKAQVRPWLESRGWSFNGKLIEGDESEARAFSTGGYGITRSKIGFRT